MFSSDGKRLAAAGKDEILVMDASNLDMSGSPAIVARLAQSGVRTLAFSPDGQFLASAGGPYAKIWNLSTSSLLKELPEAQHPIEALAFDREGKRLATASVVYHATLFDTERWTEIGWVGNRPIRGVAFSPDGKWLLTAGGGALCAWNLATAVRPPGRERDGEDATLIIEQGSSRSNVIAFAADDLLIGNGSLWRWTAGDLSTPDASKLKTPNLRGEIVAINRHATNVAVTSWGAIWQESPSRQDWTILGHILSDARIGGQPVVAFAPASERPTGVRNGDWLIVAGDDLERVDLRPGPAVKQSEARASIAGLAVSPDGRHLAMTTADGAVEILDSATLASIRREPIPLTNPEGNVSSHIEFSRDGRWLAATIGPAVTILSTADWRAVNPWGDGPRPEADKMGFSPDGRWLVLLDTSNNTISLTDSVANRTGRFSYGSAVDVVSIRRDGAQVRTRRDPRCQRAHLVPGEERVWDMFGRELQKPIPIPVAENACQTMTADIVRNAKAAEPMGSDWTTVQFARGRSNRLDSPDGRWSARVEPETPLIRLRVLGAPDRLAVGYPAGLVGTMAFSPDSRWLVTGGDDGVVRVWPVSTDMMIREACGRIRHPLSAEEWFKHLGEQPSSPVCEETGGSIFDSVGAQGRRLAAFFSGLLPR